MKGGQFSLEEEYSNKLATFAQWALVKVYEIKCEADVNADPHKAQLDIQDYVQNKDIHYKE